MKQLTLGSLFDGIGGFCYAAGIPSGIDTGCTIKPLWAAEVEPNCIDITRYRFKDVMHVGSVTELKGDEIQPVDIITFGSPCQDLSIAGKRKGLKGNRSGLFTHAIRTIRETSLLEDVVIDKHYSCQKPIETIIYDENMELYQVGELMTIWELPQIRRDVRQYLE